MKNNYNCLYGQLGCHQVCLFTCGIPLSYKLIKSKKMEQQIKLLLERMNALETRVKKN